VRPHGALKNWIDRGELTAVRVGSRRVRIKQSDLDRFLEDAETIIPKDEQQPAGADHVEAAEPELREQLGAALENARRAVSEGDNEELVDALHALTEAASHLAQAL
jgi:excisionase family DNA binding protein